MRLEVFGAEHHATIGSLTSIADAEAALGRIEQARAHYREALERVEAVLGSEHPECAALRGRLDSLAN